MRVTHLKQSSQGTITGADWDADHAVEGVVADDDPRLSDERTPTAHTHPDPDLSGLSPVGHNHDDAYSVTSHTHDTSHDHAGSYEPLGHDHAGAYSPLGHAHAHSHTASEVGAAETAHTHDTTHAHDLSAYATTADLTAHEGTSHGGGEGVPSGVIAMWAGNVNQIPSGWNLCDGTNGTPNLTDRFIKGGNPGSTGGSATHTHAAHSGVISHTHSVSVTDPGHTHVENSNNATTGGLRGWGAPDTSTNTSMATGYSTASATTGITASASAPGGAVSELTHDSVSNEPAFYTLAFIQKA